MAVRASKAALARAAELLGSDRKAAREYLRRVQERVGMPVPFVEVVTAMEDLGTDERLLVEHLREHATPPVA